MVALCFGCEHATPFYCCTDLETCREAGGTSAVVPCSDPARTFCDNSASFGDDGRTCIAEPGNGACDDVTDCTTPELPRCELAGAQVCSGCEVESDCTPFADRTRCNLDSGVCVECLAATDCPTDRPNCGSDGQCRGCLVHNDCSSQLCNADTGACVPEDQVIYVGQGGTGTACTRTTPCGSFAIAIAQVTGPRTSIHVSSGTYTERVVIDNKSFYLASEGGGLRPPSDSDGTLLSITGASRVELDGLDVLGSATTASNGISCAGAMVALTLRDVTVEDHGAIGIDSDGCRLTVLGSTIARNRQGGISQRAGELVVRNSFLHHNGGAASSIGGLSAKLPLAISVEFNSFVDNLALATSAAAIQCDTPAPVTLKNNLAVGDAPIQLSLGTCGYAYTLSNQLVDGPGNLNVAPAFVDAGDDDYHLVPNSPGIDAADPLATEPFDFDRDERPQGPRRDIGADEVTP